MGNLEGVSLTQEQEVSVVLQHHVPVQFPLSVAQASPLLLGEFYGHVPECHQSLQEIPVTKWPLTEFIMVPKIKKELVSPARPQHLTFAAYPTLHPKFDPTCYFTSSVHLILYFSQNNPWAVSCGENSNYPIYGNDHPAEVLGLA